MRCRNSPAPLWRQTRFLSFVPIAFCLCLLALVYAATWGHANAYLPVAMVPWRHGAHGVGVEVGMANLGVDAVAQDGDQPHNEDNVHPIVDLLRTAQTQFTALVASDPPNVQEAAKQYRICRGRHPPPGFDAWYAFARAHNSVIPEAFFDGVYDELSPFWGIGVGDLRRMVDGFRPKVSVRQGTIEDIGQGGGMGDALSEVITSLLHAGAELPDVDIAVYPGDLTAGLGMLVPWEEMETAVEFSRAFMPAPSEVVQTFSPWDEDKVKGSTLGFSRQQYFDPDWLDGRLRHKLGGAFLGPRPLWSLVRRSCPPHSRARKESLMTDIWDPRGHTQEEHGVAALLPFQTPQETAGGYVSNWTVAQDVCHQPHLQGLHGAFVAPEAMSVTKKIFPLFSTSKMGVSNEILFPTLAGIDNNSRAEFGTSDPWSRKDTKIYWRGIASGGLISQLNWQRMHRHRFVAMLNGTHVKVAESMLHTGNASTVGIGYAENFRLLPANPYHLATQKSGNMAEWVNSWADVGFTRHRLQCDRPADDEGCDFIEPFFSKKEDQRDESSRYAVVLDGDGGADGNEFVQRLREGRAVLKGSVWRQWYDSRMVPWVHYLPLDNTFIDLYGIMEFFVGVNVGEETSEFTHASLEGEAHEHYVPTSTSDEENTDKIQSDRPANEQEELPTITPQTRQASNGDMRAQKIAEEGQGWAEKVLRKEDVLVYTYRLVLEYARVMDKKRHSLGWVGDLVEEGGK